MKHDKHRTSLERAVARQNTLIEDVARSVRAPLPSAEKAKIVTSWNGLGWTAVREDYDLGMPVGSSIKRMPVGSSIKSEEEAIADLLEAEEALREDDEDFDSGDPPLFDAPLTDRQEAAAFHAEEIEQEFGVASRFDETDDWNDPEEDDAA